MISEHPSLVIYTLNSRQVNSHKFRKIIDTLINRLENLDRQVRRDNCISYTKRSIFFFLLTKTTI